MTAREKPTILRIMKQTRLHAYLATADGKQPTIRSMSPILGPDLTIWIATYLSSRKVKHIRTNPRVALEFTTQPDGDKLVLVLGRAKIVRDMAEKKRAWELAGFDMLQYWPEGPSAKEYCLLRVIPSRIEWRDGWGKLRVYRPRS